MSDPSPAFPVAGDEAILAGRYVNALYALAAQDKVVDAVAADMQSLRQLWDASPEWRRAMTDPRFDAAELERAVGAVAPIVGLHKLTTHFLTTVAHNRRLSLLPALAAGFLAEVTRRGGGFTAEIRAAQVLTQAQTDALTSSLAAIAGGKVQVNITQDAALLGGLTIKWGSQFIDASVKTRLDHLERMLKGAA